MINLTINKKNISVEEGTTILEAAKQNHIHIPNLCYLENIHSVGSCRICVVEIEGFRTLQPACMVKVSEGMVVKTNTKKVQDARRILFELILSDHPQDCLKCDRTENCELHKLSEIIQVTENRFEGGEKSKDVKDDSSPSITRNQNKCIMCRRCVTACNEVQGVGALNVQNRGFKAEISPGNDFLMGSVNCAYCGQCTTVCPVDALYETDSTETVWDALLHSDKHVVVQTAPAVRAALGEEFGYEAGTLVTGKMATALRDMGFDAVFDTNFTADLTILEEGTEFLTRVKNALTGKGATLPMITSCSPGWIKYIEHNYPEELDHLSTCKSPQMMLGALAKSYYAQKMNLKPEDIHVASVMPCTAKKFEITRPEMSKDGIMEVDSVITTRELAKMIKKAGIEFKELPDSDFDSPLGLSTGAADIFANTGGVMEAALRTVYELVTGRELPFEKLHVTPIVGLEQIKTASLKIENPTEDYKFLDGVEVKVAVTSGLKGAKALMEEVAKGESPYHFIEVMCCPGGCISGGGQPRPTNQEIRTKRLEAIYKEDEGKKLRKSHENPAITAIYKEFLGEPNSHKSHQLLHTHYTKRSKRPNLK